MDICCNVNTINTKEGDNLKITMQIKLQPTKEEMALLDFTMQEYISLVNDILDYAIASDSEPLHDFKADYTLPISAKNGTGLEELKNLLSELLRENKILESTLR